MTCRALRSKSNSAAERFCWKGGPNILVAKGVFILIFLIIGSFVWSGYNFSTVLLVIAWCCLSERSWLSLKNSYDRTIFLTFALQLLVMMSFGLETVLFRSDSCKGMKSNDGKGAVRNRKALRVLRRKSGWRFTAGSTSLQFGACICLARTLVFSKFLKIRSFVWNKTARPGCTIWLVELFALRVIPLQSAFAGKGVPTFWWQEESSFWVF